MWFWESYLLGGVVSKSKVWADCVAELMLGSGFVVREVSVLFHATRITVIALNEAALIEKVSELSEADAVLGGEFAGVAVTKRRAWDN